MTSISEVINGSLTATSFTGSGAGLTNISRSSIAAGTLNFIVYNDATTGLLNQEQFVSAAQGGTGIDTSAVSGIPTISSGTWSTTSTLSPTFGGTGQNFSGIGAGPFVVTISSGVFSANVGYTTANTANTLVERDGSSNINVTTVTTATVASTANLTLSPTGGNVLLGTSTLQQTPTTVAGSNVVFSSANVQTTNATATTLFSVSALAGTNGGTYGVKATVSAAVVASGGATAMYVFYIKIKNEAGTVTSSGIAQITSINDAPLVSNPFSISIASTTASIQVTGIAATTINWVAAVCDVSQTF